MGREGCDILIDDKQMKVSRSHIDITYRLFTGGHFYVITDHSANGTMVNGKRLGRGETVNIPAEGETPEVFLACDKNYPLDWENVRKLIASKIATRYESSKGNPNREAFVAEGRPLENTNSTDTKEATGRSRRTIVMAITAASLLAVAVMVWVVLILLK